MLLHYSSNSLLSRSYPALFLGNWEHVFLDGVGNDSATFKVDEFIEIACEIATEESKPKMPEIGTQHVFESTKALLPRMQPIIAAQKLFYPGQNSVGQDSFNHRKAMLDKLLLTPVGTSCIGDIICKKFGLLWLEFALVRTATTAAESLLRGITQLSLSTSIHAVLVQTFHVYFKEILLQINQRLNLDVIADASSRSDTSKLFGVLLQELPVAPLEELVLQRRLSMATRLHPLPVTRVHGAKARFPFFAIVSRYIDEVIENAEEAHSKNCDINSAPGDVHVFVVHCPNLFDSLCSPNGCFHVCRTSEIVCSLLDWSNVKCHA